MRSRGGSGWKPGAEGGTRRGLVGGQKVASIMAGVGPIGNGCARVCPFVVIGRVTPTSETVFVHRFGRQVSKTVFIHTTQWCVECW